MTANIVLLAVQDGEMRIDAAISLKMDFGLFKAPLTFIETQEKPWNSPF